MKELLSKVLFYGVCILVIVGCFKALELQDQYEKERAITRCGGESNIVTKHTKDGDKYFLCKVEK